MLQTLQVRNTFVSRDVEKMDVALERSTCKSQNICNKVKKNTKHTSLEPLLEVQLLKKCTPL
jgi:hypothetical protein